MPLTRDQQRHLYELIETFKMQVEKKYTEGAKEHGGNLWDKGIIFLLDQAIQENIDQFTYLTTCRDELRKIEHLLPKPKAIDIDRITKVVEEIQEQCTCETHGIGKPRYDTYCPQHGVSSTL